MGQREQGGDSRADADTRFMRMAHKIRDEFSTCESHKIAAVVVGADGEFKGAGWNGAAPKEPHCEKVGCARHGVASGDNLHWCRGLHAESGAIAAAAAGQGGFRGGTMFTTCWPCRYCWALIGGSGLSWLVYDEKYADPEGAPPSMPPASVKVRRWKGASTEVSR